MTLAVSSAVVAAALAVSSVACGKLGFDEPALTMQLLAGATTVELEICGPPSKYWITTRPAPAGWTAETLESKLDGAAVLHAGDTPRHGYCMTKALPIGYEGIDVHAYAVTESRDGALEATATMQPTWARATSPLGNRMWIHRPESWYRAPSAPLPVLVFLHGLGHATDDEPFTFDSLPVDSGFLELFNERPAPPLRDEVLAALPFLMVAPHCPQDGGFGGAPVDCWGWSPAPQIYDDMMEHVRDQFVVDERRIYVTGLSTGGEGTFHLAAERTREIAAAVPVATTFTGGVWTKARFCSASEVPVWAFHNEPDTLQLPENSQRFVDELNACSPAIPAQVSRGVWSTAGLGHAGWYEAYGNTHGMTHEATGKTSIYDWLLKHTR